jgi:hypothetical protein
MFAYLDRGQMHHLKQVTHAPFALLQITDSVFPHQSMPGTNRSPHARRPISTREPGIRMVHGMEVRIADIRLNINIIQ